MKKLLCMAFAVICLSACGGGKETETLTCKLEQAGNGLKTVIDLDMAFKGSDVVSQDQVSVITADSEEVYKKLIPTLKEFSKEEAFKGLEGVTYSYVENAEKFNIVEKITIDFDKISADDYKIVSGDPSIDLSKDRIDIDKTKENLEEGKFVCKKQ